MTTLFEVQSVNEDDHTVVVGYWTDVLPKEQFFDRTRVNIGIPLDLKPDPESQEFRDFILQFAPQQWFDVLEAKAAGNVDPLAPLVGGVASFQQQVVAEAQLRLDVFAQKKGYDSILSCASYATSAIPQFAKESQIAVNMRDATWATLYSIMAAVEAGTRPVPTLEQILAELPELTWPA